MPTPTDAELLRLYAESRSEEAFSELVRRHLPLIFNTALRRTGGDTHRAEEIAQTVFTHLAQKAAQLSRHPALTGWLHTSTRYAAAELVRKEQRRQTRELEAQSMPNDSTSPVDWEHLRPVIDEALDQLDERDRAAVLLRFFENQQLSQIGKTLALSEDAARKRIDRALEKLRRQLAKRGIASTSTALGLALANNIAVAAPATLATSITSTVVAGTAAASTSSLLSLLAMTKLQSGTLAALIVALAATAGSVSLGVVVSRQQTELSAAPALASAQSDTDNRLLAELHEKLAAAEKDRDAIRAYLKKLADKKAKRAREEEAALRGPSQLLFKRLYFRQNLTLLFDQLKLDEATRQKFIALLIEDSTADIAATLKTRKTTGEDDAPMEERTAHWRTTHQKIQDLVGKEGLEAYFEYQALQVGAPKDFALDLTDAGCPLTPEQQQKLGHLWYQIVALPQSSAFLNFTGEINPLEQTFLVQARKDLSETQAAILRRFFVNENADHRAVKQRFSTTK